MIEIMGDSLTRHPKVVRQISQCWRIASWKVLHPKDHSPRQPQLVGPIFLK